MKRVGQRIWRALVNLLLLVALALMLSGYLRIVEGLGGRGIDFYQFWAVARSIPAGIHNIYSVDDRVRIGQVFRNEAYERFRRARLRYEKLEALQRSPSPPFTTGNDTLQFARRELIFAERQLGTANFRSTRRQLEAFSSPLLYACFYPFTGTDYDRQLHLYSLFSLACYISAIVCIGRTLQLSVMAILFSLLLFAGPIFGPFESDLRVGNVNQIQLAMLALFLWLRRFHDSSAGDYAAGFILGLAVMFKPNMVLIPIGLSCFWIANRRFRCLMFSALGNFSGALAAILASGLYFGSLRCWMQWIEALSKLSMRTFDAMAVGNRSLARFVWEIGGKEVSLILAVALCATMFYAIWQGRRTVEFDGRRPPTLSRFEQEFLVTGAACAITLLASPLSWHHYFVLLIPFVLFWFRPIAEHSGVSRRQRITTRVLAAIGAIGLFEAPFAVITGFADGVAFTLLASAATATLYCLAIWGLHPYGSKA